MRTRLLGAAAAAALTAGVGIASAAPAQAAGFYTIKSATVGKYLSTSSFTHFGLDFKPQPGVTYRYCVVGRGTGTANLQPTAFATTATFSNSSLLVTRCTKSWRTPSNYGSWMGPAANKLSGSVYISRAYVQRYTTSSVPV
ncbi:hypothetical protein [Knoellia flava]|uniref:Uncharacterized protein n=1 Tax=Knoellia flava TaxID=913969 RepID=A0A8H9FTK2_9MICO|nr:hypothetical protein [Knoellia flava]GGB78126.1 hypothetical protein GCM10011314_17240 [Knoellia flava]